MSIGRRPSPTQAPLRAAWVWFEAWRSRCLQRSTPCRSYRSLFQEDGCGYKHGAPSGAVPKPALAIPPIPFGIAAGLVGKMSKLRPQPGRLRYSIPNPATRPWGRAAPLAWLLDSWRARSRGPAYRLPSLRVESSRQRNIAVVVHPSPKTTGFPPATLPAWLPSQSAECPISRAPHGGFSGTLTAHSDKR